MKRNKNTLIKLVLTLNTQIKIPLHEFKVKNNYNLKQVKCLN